MLTVKQKLHLGRVQSDMTELKRTELDWHRGN